MAEVEEEEGEHLLLWHHGVPGEEELEVEAYHGLPETAGHGAEEAHREEEDDDAQDDEVEQLVDGGALELGLARVLHELGVLASEEHHAVAPGRVPQHGAPQHHLHNVNINKLINK